MRACFAIMACALLPACGTLQSMKVDEARMNFADYETECHAQWPVVTRQTAIPRAACLNEAETATLLPAAGEFADLVNQRMAYRTALAGKIAAGAITPQQAQTDFASFNARLSAQAHARPVTTNEAKATAQEAFPADAAEVEQKLQNPAPQVIE